MDEVTWRCMESKVSKHLNVETLIALANGIWAQADVHTPRVAVARSDVLSGGTMLFFQSLCMESNLNHHLREQDWHTSPSTTG